MGQMWWLTSLILAFLRWKQVDICEFQTILVCNSKFQSYIEDPISKTVCDIAKFFILLKPEKHYFQQKF